MPNVINAELFCHEADPRPITKQSIVSAPISEVYAAWTDGDTFCRVYDPENKSLTANIELKVGGKFEWLWDGHTGSNDCQVLSFIPDRMISFSWNAPPNQPSSRALRTWVVVEFETLDGVATQVTLTHLGFGSAPHWEETRNYFDAAWEIVLARLEKNLQK